MAVVKANAYGHGLVPTALALSQVDAFAVARLDEGIVLRAQGIAHPIVLLEGVFAAEQLLEAAHYGFDLVVHDDRQIELLEEATTTHRFTVWVKIDSGMNRLGFRTTDFRAALQRLRSLRPPPLQISLLTHLARADEPDNDMSHEQIARFKEATCGLDHATSIASSAGLFADLHIGSDWVRPGLAIYGASPFAECNGTDLGLEPVMSLETSVIAMRKVSSGETVGYGGTWQAQRESRVAILAAGYGDGLPRSLPNGTPVLVDGRRAPLCGRVSMDMIAVDVTDLPGVGVGTSAMLWGKGLPVEEVARHAGTIPYELLCGVSQRVPLEFG